MRAILAILCGVLLSAPALAADLPVAPPSPMMRPGDNAVQGVPFAQTFSLGGLSLGFADLSLKDTRTKVGGGVIDSLGQDAERIEWLCYEVPGARLWLAQDRSATRELTLMPRPATAPPSSHCPALPAKFQTVKIDGFLTLGTTRAELIQRLGPPAKQAGDWLAFQRKASKPGDNDNELIVRLENGKVAALWAKKQPGR